MHGAAFGGPPLRNLYGEGAVALGFFAGFTTPGEAVADAGAVFAGFRALEVLILDSPLGVPEDLRVGLGGDETVCGAVAGSPMLLDKILEKAIGFAVLVGGCSSLIGAALVDMLPFETTGCD